LGGVDKTIAISPTVLTVGKDGVHVMHVMHVILSYVSLEELEMF
jgi:hypothetical protein